MGEDKNRIEANHGMIGRKRKRKSMEINDLASNSPPKKKKKECQKRKKELKAKRNSSSKIKTVQNTNIDKTTFDKLSADDLFTMFDEWFNRDNNLSKKGLRDKLSSKYHVDTNTIKKDKRFKVHFKAAVKRLRDKYS